MNQDIRSQLARARESLAAADLLRERGYYGFSTSRAYYAMLYVAEALLASLDQSYSSHGAVHGAYGREFAKTGRLDAKFHGWLLDAQDFRNTGDYGIGVSITPEQAGQVCAWAREFIQSAESWLSERKG